MLLNVIHKDFSRAKVNSKDAYLTVPVAEKKKKLLPVGFPKQQGVLRF